MKIVFIGYQTNIWHCEPELLIVGSSIEKVLFLIKKKGDVVLSVKNQTAHVIIERHIMDEIDSGERLFDTGFDAAYFDLVGEKKRN